MREEQVLNYLKNACRGRAKAQYSAHIERTLHIGSKELQKAVNRLRRKGIPIASDKHGYYYAITASEVYTTICQLKRMAEGLKAAISGLERSMDSFGPGGGMP